MIRTVRAALTSIGAGFLLLFPHPLTALGQGSESQPRQRKTLEEIFGPQTGQEDGSEERLQKLFDSVTTADSVAREETERQKQREIQRERIDRWLWTLPLAALALVIVVSIRGEAIKAWIGRLHVGQMIILVGGLLVGVTLLGPAALFFVQAWGSEGDWSWLLGFTPLGPISALLVLWFWFGARAKMKGGG